MRSSRAGAALILAALTLLGCGENISGGPSPDPWEAVELPRAKDLDPSPDVFELELEAGVGKARYVAAGTTPVWTYNGTSPGPLIELHVGDRLKAHFRNALPEETTIHWHGLRIPAAMDGTMAMQNPTQPGGTFEYEFVIKDPGLFWFHPHVRSDEQVEKGLYAPILVRGPNDPSADREVVWMLDDVALEADGSRPEYLDDESKMLGRHGDTLLVNGVVSPTVEVQAGELLRMRLVNAANGRFFNLAMSGQTFRVIGSDGGFLPKPYDTDRVLIAPGERYDVMLVVSAAPGEKLELTNEPYERGHGTGEDPPMRVATLRVSKQPALEGRVLPAAFPDIEALPAQPVDFPIVLNEAMVGADMTFTVNGKAFPDVPTLSVPNGSLRVLGVSNESEMDHPFHLHGFFFQVLAKNGVPMGPEAPANKDTIIVPAKGSLDLIARFDEPGMWMYHCHILEHAEGGMAGLIQVE